MPERVQRKRTKGWRMPPNTISVCRPGIWGNPYRGELFGLHLAIDLFRETASGGWNPSLVSGMSDYLARHAYELHTEWCKRFRQKTGWMEVAFEAQHSLRGKNLACYCPLDKPCHADVLLELANQGVPR